MPRVGFPLSSVYQRLYYPFFTRTVLQVEKPTSINRGRENDRHHGGPSPPECPASHSHTSVSAVNFFWVQGRKPS